MFKDLIISIKYQIMSERPFWEMVLEKFDASLIEKDKVKVIKEEKDKEE